MKLITKDHPDYVRLLNQFRQTGHPQVAIGNDPKNIDDADQLLREVAAKHLRWDWDLMVENCNGSDSEGISFNPEDFIQKFTFWGADGHREMERTVTAYGKLYHHTDDGCDCPVFVITKLEGFQQPPL